MSIDDKIEELYIKQGINITEIAKQLNVARSTIYRHMKDFQLLT